MTEKEVFTKVAKIIEDHFNYPADKVTSELSFQDDLDADSIDIVEFVLELEETFDDEISDDDAEKLATVGQAVSYISAHQKN